MLWTAKVSLLRRTARSLHLLHPSQSGRWRQAHLQVLHDECHCNGSRNWSHHVSAFLDYARKSGYRGMQFNFVVSTNTRAVTLWETTRF